MLKVSDPNRHDYLSCANHFAVVQSKIESVLQTFDAEHKLVFELWNHSVPESHAVGYKGVKLYRNAAVRVLDPAFFAKLPQREGFIRIVNVRRKTVGFKQHAFGHMLSPAVHGLTKDAERDAATTEMCGDGKSVWTGANDRSSQHSFRNNFPLKINLDCLCRYCTALGKRTRSIGGG